MTSTAADTPMDTTTAESDANMESSAAAIGDTQQVTRMMITRMVG